MQPSDLTAPAKINLFLRVLGRRADGYRELESLMVPLALYDRVRVEPTAARGQIQVTCPGKPELDGPANLAHQAAEAWLEQSGAGFGVNISIHKKIPVKAGLGGGSSDAASVLKALQAMGEKPISEGELHALATRLGADVPFFLQARPCLAQGIGERLSPVSGLPRLWVLLAQAPRGLPTRQVFEKLKFTLTFSNRGDSHCRPCKWGFEQLVAALGNDLQPTAESLYPDIGRVRAKLLRAGAAGAALSGSGPSVFGLFPSRKTAREALRRVRNTDGWTYQVVRAITQAEHNS